MPNLLCLYCVLLYCTVLYSIALDCTKFVMHLFCVEWCIDLHCIVALNVYCIVSYVIALCCTLLRIITLLRTFVLCITTPLPCVVSFSHFGFYLRGLRYYNQISFRKYAGPSRAFVRSGANEKTNPWWRYSNIVMISSGNWGTHGIGIV